VHVARPKRPVAGRQPDRRRHRKPLDEDVAEHLRVLEGARRDEVGEVPLGQTGARDAEQLEPGVVGVDHPTVGTDDEAGQPFGGPPERLVGGHPMPVSVDVPGGRFARQVALPDDDARVERSKASLERLGGGGLLRARDARDVRRERVVRGRDRAQDDVRGAGDRLGRSGRHALTICG
jgi:hypothetical protein